MAGLAPVPAPNKNPDLAGVGFTAVVVAAADPPKLKLVAELPGDTPAKLNPEVELAVLVVTPAPKLNLDSPTNPIFPAYEGGVPPKLKPPEALEAGPDAAKENTVAVDWDVVVDADYDVYAYSSVIVVFMNAHNLYFTLNRFASSVVTYF